MVSTLRKFVRADLGRQSLVAVLLIAVPNNALLGQETDLRRAFLADYEPHATKLAHYYSNVFVKYEMTYDQGNGDAQVAQMEAKLNSRNCLTTAITSRIIEQKTGKIRKELGRETGVRNPYYFCRLGPGFENDLKVIELKFIKSELDIQDPNLRFPFALLAPNPRTYLDLARDQKVRILAYQNAVWRNKNVKQLTIAYEFYFAPQKKILKPEIKCFFDPAAEWVCTGTESADAGTNLSLLYFYEKGDNAEVPVPVRAETIVDGRLLFKFVFSEFRKEPPFDDAAFRLSAFGLPEPMGVPPVARGGIRWYVWLALAGFGCGALGFLFFKVKQRIQRKAPVAIV